MNTTSRYLLIALLLLVAGFSHADHAASPFQVTVETQVYGQGKNATRWLAIRAAQAKLAQQLPRSIHFTTTVDDDRFNTIIHETLAQTASLEINKLEITVHKESKAETPTYVGPVLNRIDTGLDDAGNPIGTIYRAEGSFTFKVIPAAMVERARLIKENTALREQLLQAPSSNDEELHYDPVFLLSQLNRHTHTSPRLQELERKYGAAIDSGNTSQLKQLQDQVVRLTRSQSLQEQAQNRANLQSDLPMLRDKTHLWPLAVQAHYADIQSQVERFIQLLPLAYANTLKVTSAHIETPEYLGTFGADFYMHSNALAMFNQINERTADHIDPVTAQMPGMFVSNEGSRQVPTDRLIIRIDKECEFNAPSSSSVLNRCDLMRLLPEAVLNRFWVEGVFSGDSKSSFNSLIREFQRPQTNLPLPVVTSSIPPAGQALMFERSPLRNNTEKYLGYPSVLNHIRKSSTLSFPNTPTLLAAGFFDRPPVTLTVLFPLTKEFIDIPLTSDRYILSPSFVEVFLQDERISDSTIRNKRKLDIRATVWWPGDEGEVSHPAPSSWSAIPGGLHYATVPAEASDLQSLKYLHWLRKNKRAIAIDQNPAGSMRSFRSMPRWDIATGMSHMACKHGWAKALSQFSPFIATCSREDRLVIQYGKPPVMNTEGIEVFVGSGQRNNPMKPIDKQRCLMFDPDQKTMVQCNEFLSDFRNLIRTQSRLSIPNERQRHDFWESVKRGSFGEPPRFLGPAQDNSRTIFTDHIDGTGKFW